MGIQSIVLSLIALVNLALNTMSLPCLRRGERRRCLLVFSRYESYRPCLCTYLSLPLHGNVSQRRRIRRRIEDRCFWPPPFPIFLLFSYVSRHRTIKFTRTSKAIEQKRFENKYRNIGEDAFVGDVNHRRQRRFDIVVSMSIHPSVLFSSLDSFPSTLSSEYWLLGANGLRYRLIQMRTGFHSKLDGATVSAML